MNILECFLRWLIIPKDILEVVPEDFISNCTVHHTASNSDDHKDVALVITYKPKNVKLSIPGAIFTLMSEADREAAFLSIYKKQKRVQF